ncbi:MAG: hypothetical protein ACR2I0_01935, partial [Rhodoferax sp.]
MIRSFRLRLAIWSALLTALVLAAFGLGSWWVIRSIKIERLDSEIRILVEREVGRARNVTEWADAEGRMAAALGLHPGADVLFKVESAEAQPVYQSAQWPAAWDSVALPWPDPQTPRLAPRLGFSWVAQAQAATLPEAQLLAQAGPFGAPGRSGPGPRPRPGPEGAEWRPPHQIGERGPPPGPRPWAPREVAPETNAPPPPQAVS